MRDVAIIGFAQTTHVRRQQHLNEVEMLMPVLEEVPAAGPGHQGRHRVHVLGVDRLPRRRRRSASS